MNDRELLELAAKAAGIDGEYENYLHGHVQVSGIREQFALSLWNPLNNDGDAFRLSINLGFVVTCTLSAKTSWAGIHCYDIAEKHGNNPYAATRRAIVRAAAEIGKTK